MTVKLTKQGLHRPTNTAVQSLRSQPVCIDWFSLPSAYENMGDDTFQSLLTQCKSFKMSIISGIIPKRIILLALLFIGELFINQNAWAQESIVTYNPAPWLPTIWKSEPPAGCPFKPSTEISGIAFTRKYVSYTDADTFYPSWASDDKMYSGWTDGEIGLENCQSGGGEHAKTGIVRIEGDDPMNLELTSLGLLAASALPYGGRYPSANLVHDEVWYFGTYGLDYDFSKPEYRREYSWAICGPLPGFAISERNECDN